MEKIKKIKPSGIFTNYVYKTIPLAFDESMSYYETLCGLLDFMKNSIVPTVNNNSDVVIELQNYVTNYFDDLDVQEEINNKLDEMVESGTLDQIIEQYLTSSAIWGFDNVEDMKNASNLINGSYAKTLGYYVKNDGGSGLYKIRNITNDDIIDNATIIPLNDSMNNLIAELVITKPLNPIQFGCYGDGLHDDVINLQKCISFCENKKLKLTSPGNKIYKISSTLNIDTLLCNFNNAEIKTDNNINLITINSTNYYGQLEQIKLNCANTNSGIYIQNGRKKTFKDLIFLNIKKYGFYYNAGYEILLSDSHMEGNGTIGTVGIYANSSDSKFENIILIDCHTGIYNKGLNFFNYIHGWIRTNNIVQTSIFADLKSNRCYFSQCYSDTYGITFNCDGGLFSAEQLEIFFNDSIWTENLPSPYAVYFPNSNNRAISNRIINSRLNGVRANQRLSLSNEDISLIQLNNNMKTWVSNYVGIKGSLTGLSNNITEVYTNELNWDNGIVTLDFIAKVTVNPNDTRNISTAILPEYFQPEVNVNSNCLNCADRWQLGQNSYLFISTNVTATLNYIEGATSRIIKIHAVYKSKQFANI